MTTPITVEPPESRRQLHRLVRLPLEPYYDRDGITIYNANCRQVLPFLDSFDVLLTDPPYGVEFQGRRDRTGAVVAGTYDAIADSSAEFQMQVVPILTHCVSEFRTSAIFTSTRMLSLIPQPKDIGSVFSDCCQGMSSFGFTTVHLVALYGKDVKKSGESPGVYPNGFCHRGKVTTCKRHPCSKPLEWMRWFVRRLSADGDVIVDPFMGSGTTLLAAKLEGHRAIGIEISEEYCSVAVDRLRQRLLFGGMDAAVSSAE